jgi:hypothetical protein
VSIHRGDLPRARLVVQGEATITVTNLSWLLSAGKHRSSNGCWQRIRQTYTALIIVAANLTDTNAKTVQWLLEYGGADTMYATPDGRTPVWALLLAHFVESVL